MHPTAERAKDGRVPTAAGRFYPAGVLDLYSRRIVGWAISDSLHRQYVTYAEAQLDIFEYIEVFYNRIRRHSAPDDLSPVASVILFPPVY